MDFSPSFCGFLGVRAGPGWGARPPARVVGELAALFSPGYLVPGFAALLLWLRRDQLALGSPRSNRWGWPLLAGAIGLRLVGGYYHFVWFDAISLLPCLAGLCLLLGGTRALRWA